MKKLVPILLAAVFLAHGSALAQDLAQTRLPRTTLSVGIHQIDTQLATTQEQHATGLMHRQDMPQHEGMLFVFENPARQCFWMKNTVPFVLQMNQGWFTKKGIKPGSKISGRPFSP